MIDPTEHVDWAKKVAASISRDQRFPAGSQEEEELKAVAVLTLFRRAPDFDPARVPPGGNAEALFRGWLHRCIVGACVREARRLRTGGTMHSANTRASASIRVGPLPVHDAEGFEEIAIEDQRETPEPDEPAEEPEPVPVEPQPARPPAAWFVCPTCGGWSKLRPTEPRACLRCARPPATRRLTRF